VDKPLKSVTHGLCDARPTVTFPAAEPGNTKICYLCKKIPQSPTHSHQCLLADKFMKVKYSPLKPE